MRPVTIEWPNGDTATFDGAHWTSVGIWSSKVLDLIPLMVSVMLEDWEYWHAQEVAAEVGAEVTTPGPAEPVLVADLVMPDDDLNPGRRVGSFRKKRRPARKADAR
jgi:hypothetical protein